MRNNLTKVIAIISCLSFLNCSNEKEVLEVANSFFSRIDKGDYRTAYQLLSQIDKQTMDADSFHVFCHLQVGLRNQDDFELHSIIMEDFQAVSTIIAPNLQGTFVVTQVLRIPDFQLILKTMGETKIAEKFSEFYKRVKSQSTIPTRLDSSRTIIVSNNDGQFVVTLGLSEYAKYDSLLKKIEEENLSKISIKPIRMRIYYPYATAAELKYQIENQGSLDVSSITCVLYIDGTMIDENIAFFEDIKAGKKEVRDDFIILDDEAKLPSSTSKVMADKRIELISGKRIKLIPRSVYFDPEYDNSKKKVAMKNAGFEGFSFFKLSVF